MKQDHNYKIISELKLPNFIKTILFSIISYCRQPTAPKIQHSINTSIGKYFMQENNKVVQDLYNQNRDDCIYRVQKLSKCRLSEEVTNKAIEDSCSGPGYAERGKIKQRSVVPFVSEATSNNTKKDEMKYVEIKFRHAPAKQDTKKNNYNIHVRIFDYNAVDDLLYQDSGAFLKKIM